MSDTTAHIAAPISRTIKGTAYELSPLTMSDIIRIQDWVRQSIYNEAKAFVSGLDLELASRLLDKAKEKADAASPGTVAFDKAMMSVGGVYQIFYLTLRHNHKDIDYDKAEELLDAEVLANGRDEIMKVLTKLAGFKGADELPFVEKKKK